MISCAVFAYLWLHCAAVSLDDVNRNRRLTHSCSLLYSRQMLCNEFIGLEWFEMLILFYFRKMWWILVLTIDLQQRCKSRSMFSRKYPSFVSYSDTISSQEVLPLDMDPMDPKVTVILLLLLKLKLNRLITLGVLSHTIHLHKAVVIQGIHQAIIIHLKEDIRAIRLMLHRRRPTSINRPKILINRTTIWMENGSTKWIEITVTTHLCSFYVQFWFCFRLTLECLHLIV